jgi:predicted DNA-binding WGR domain protein
MDKPIVFKRCRFEVSGELIGVTSKSYDLFMLENRLTGKAIVAQRWGKGDGVETAGQSRVTPFDSIAGANRLFNKTVSDRDKHGYRQVGSQSSDQFAVTDLGAIDRIHAVMEMANVRADELLSRITSVFSGANPQANDIKGKSESRSFESIDRGAVYGEVWGAW